MSPGRVAALRAAVDGFVPADAREAGHRQRVLALLDAPGDPFDRERYAPGHITASAFVLGPSGRLLLILHGKLGLWLQPGGHVDPQDADALAAARREVHEEAGLSDVRSLGLLDLDVHPIPARTGAPGHEHFDVRFLLRTADEGARAGSDARAVRWVELDAVGDAGTDDSVLRAVRKLRALDSAPGPG